MMVMVCDACEKVIEQQRFLEVRIRVLDPGKDDNQEALEEFYGDYCDSCVASGAAMEDLVRLLTDYRGFDATTVNHEVVPRTDPGQQPDVGEDVPGGGAI